jgi:hypothetical protein
LLVHKRKIKIARFKNNNEAHGGVYFYTTADLFVCFLKYVEPLAKGKLARTVRVVLLMNWLLKGR